MNCRSLALKCLFALACLVAGVMPLRAQYVYKIKADTVRIYNTCDTAELVLQNRTQNVLGYLYNKGGGVTEFRALNAIDLMYKSNDTLYYRLSSGQIVPIKIGLSAAEQSGSFILNQNASAQTIANAWISGNFRANSGYQSMRTTVANGTGDYSILDLTSGNNRWGIGRMVQELGSNSGSDFVIKGYQDNGSEIGNYLVLNRANKAATFGGHIKIGDSTNTTAATYFDYRKIASSPVTASYGVGITTGSSGGAGMTSVSGAGLGRSLVVPYDGNAPVFSSNGGATWDSVWHAGNHGKGSAFDQVFGSGFVLSRLTTNPSGHITAITVRTMTAAEIGAAASNSIRLDSVLAHGNTAVNNIILGGAAVTGSNEVMIQRSVSSKSYTGRFAVAGNSADVEGGAIVTNSVSGGAARVLTVPADGSTVYFSQDGATTMLPVWHSGNHPAGSPFSPALTGANVISSLITNAAGHVTTLTTRTLQPSDIGAAVDSGSSKYIQNQTGSVQAGGFNVGGTGAVGLLTLSVTSTGAPTFSTRSIGTKAVWYSNIGASTADYATGIETNHIWQSVPLNSDVQGFKFYGGTSLVARISGSGGAEFAGQGRFKGWYVSGTGQAAEAGVTGNVANFMGYDRTTPGYISTVFSGGAGSTVKRFQLDGTGYRLTDFTGVGLLGTDASGYLVDKSASFAPAVAGGYIQNQNTVAQTTANAWVSGNLSATTLYTSAPSGTPQHIFYTGTNQQLTTASRRWLFTFANADGTNTGSDFALQRCDNTGSVNGTPLFLQRSSGFIGINNTAPTDQLTVNGNSRTVGIVVAERPTAATAGFFAMKNSNSLYRWAMGTTGTESTGTTGANFTIFSYDSSGNVLRNNDFFINRTTGFVGLGTITPDVKLQVIGSAKSNLLYTDVSSSVYHYLRTAGGVNRWAWGSTGPESSGDLGSNLTLYSFNDAGGTKVAFMSFDRANTRVGINQATPGQRLSVAGSFSATDSVILTKLTGTGLVKQTNGYLTTALAGTDYAPATGSTAYAQATGGNGYIQANPSATQAASFTINGTGSFKSSAYTGSINEYEITSNYRSGMNIQSTASINNILTGAQSNSFCWRWLSVDNGTPTYTTDVNEKMRLTFDGKLGIATNSPQSTLEVAGVAAVSGATSAFMWSDRTLSGNNKWQWYSTGGSTYLFDVLNQVNRVAVSNAGNMAIGKDAAAAGYKLDVNGYIQSTGFYQTSLRSLKKDIKPFTESATKILDSAQVRTFVYKADSAQVKHIGFIADEVPDAMASPARQGVDQANTTALLVKALQETNARLEAMEKRVAELEKELKEKNK